VRYAVLWFYWNGYSWARVLVLLGSLLGLWDLTAWMHVSAFVRILIAVKTALALFLLYWLNTRSLRDYFDPRIQRIL